MNINLDDYSFVTNCSPLWGRKYNNWLLYKRESKLIETSYLVHPETQEHTPVKLVQKEYAFKWNLPAKFVIEEDWIIEFSDEKRKLGLYRFPLMKEGKTFKEQSDILYNVSPEDVDKVAPGFDFDFTNTKVVSFDINKIKAICFELKEIPETELKRVEKEWKEISKKQIMIEEELGSVSLLMESNYEAQINTAKKVAALQPRYEDILRDLLLSKINIDNASELTDNIITKEIL